MSWSLRVITSLTADTEPCLAVVCEQNPRRYVFNVGEGTTRACVQNRFGLSKTRAIFLTRIDMEQIGGFPGMIMSLADMGVQDVQVCGPQGLAHYVASTRRYSRRTLLGVKLEEVSPVRPQTDDSMADSVIDKPSCPIFKDDNLTVYGIPILPLAHSSSARRSSTASGSSDSSRKRKRPSTPDSPSKCSAAEEYNAPRRQARSSYGPRRHASSVSVDEAEAERVRLQVTQSMFRPPGAPYPSTPVNQYGDADCDPPPVASSAHDRLPSAQYAPQVVAYLVIGNPTRAKFDVQKTMQLGVPKGPLWAKLGRGETVLTPDGVMVTPEMCIAPSKPPTAFMFIHCPDPTYIDNIVGSPCFDPKTYNKGAVLHVIIHRAGDGVLEDVRYKRWMNSFSPDVHHLVANERYSTNPAVFTSAAAAQLQLTDLDPDIFRIPHYSMEAAGSLSSVRDLPPKTTLLRKDLDIKMNPPSDPQRWTFTPEDTFQTALAEKARGTLENPLADVYARARAAVIVGGPAQSQSAECSDVVITTLGTGSAMPSKYRNVSGNLIQIPKWGNILLDCGEGTLGQIARSFGPDQLLPTRGNSEGSSIIDGVSGECAEGVLRNLKCIFISHIHGDHHMGLAKILARRRALSPTPSEPVYIIAPISVFQYLHEQNDLQDLGIRDPAHVRTIGARRFCPGDIEVENAGLDEASLESALGLDSVTTVMVEHRVQCFGVVLRHKDGWSVCYSGDTMPCDSLVEAGQDATVLIHEATMADDEIEHALAKRHSTFGQAIDVGRRMRAKNILLTHFSQRYPKLPDLKRPSVVAMLDEAGETHEATTSSIELTPEAPIAIAFDCASFRIGSLWKMEKYAEALEKVFADEELSPMEGVEEPSVSSPSKNGKKQKGKTSTFL